MTHSSLEAAVPRSPQLRILRNYLLAIATVCLLSVIPYTGVIMMIMLGPLWASLLVNAMMLHLTLRTLFSKSPRIWLAIPVCFYAAWATVYAIRSSSDEKTLRQYESLSHVDEKVPENTDLIFDKDDPLAPAVKKIVMGGRVFTGNFEIQIIRPDDSKPGSCYGQINPKSGERAFGYFRATPDYDKPSTCVVARASAAPQAGLHFRRLPDPNGRSMDWRRAAYALELEDNTGNSRTVGRYEFGVVDTMSQWPLFWAGCTLNSAAPSWQCSFVRPLTHAALYGATAHPDRNWDEAHARAIGELLARPTRRVLIGF